MKKKKKKKKTKYMDLHSQQIYFFRAITNSRLNKMASIQSVPALRLPDPMLRPSERTYHCQFEKKNDAINSKPILRKMHSVHQTQVMHAIRSRNQTQVEHLTQFVDVNVPDVDGWTLLHVAMIYCVPEILRHLVACGAKDQRIARPEGFTASLLRPRLWEIITGEMIDYPIGVLTKTTLRREVWKYLHAFRTSKPMEVFPLEVIVRFCCQLADRCNESKRKLSVRHQKMNRPSRRRRRSLHKPLVMDVFHRSLQTTTLIEKAIQANHLPLLRLMIELGTRPNCMHRMTWQSPLIFACRIGNAQALELMLRMGGDPNMGIPLRANSIYRGWKPIHFTLCNIDQDANCLRVLLRHPLIDVNRPELVLQTTPLLFLLSTVPKTLTQKEYFREKLQLLLQAGANARMCDCRGAPPLALAYINGSCWFEKQQLLHYGSGAIEAIDFLEKHVSRELSNELRIDAFQWAKTDEDEQHKMLQTMFRRWRLRKLSFYVQIQSE